MWSLACFGGAVAVYAVLLRVGLFNEIEGAAGCEALLVLTLLLIPAIQHIRSAATEPVAVPDTGRERH